MALSCRRQFFVRWLDRSPSRRSGVRALLALALGATVACGNDLYIETPPLQITLTSTSVSCAPGQQVTVGVTVAGGSGGSAAAVQFTPVSTSLITNGITTDSASLARYTFTCGSVPGASAITFTITSGGQTAFGTIPVSITAGGSPLAIAITPASIVVGVGGTAGPLLAAVTLPPGVPNSSTAVRWHSAAPDIASVDSLTGVVRGVAAGQTLVTAVAVADGNLKSSVPVSVGGPSFGSLTLGATALNLMVGQSQPIVATVVLSPNAPAGTPTGVTCTSADSTIVTISGGGTTPCAVVAVGGGLTAVTVRAVADPTLQQTIAVAVGSFRFTRFTFQSLSAVGPNGTLRPADPSNVSGTIAVTLGVDLVDARADSLVVSLGAARVRCPLPEPSAAGAVSTVSCQINTAADDPATGVPAVPNGAQLLSATLYFRAAGSGTGPGAAQRASIQQPLTVNNHSG
jgi:uncharacterized protein YjdB